jgi:hypothetical protein
VGKPVGGAKGEDGGGNMLKYLIYMYENRIMKSIKAA